ncbi:MAG: FMN-binding protein [Candidatus Omnitrophota bacterium]|nr:MAG: FMN-binding protein [Candidatus Omnitrophota bacterium]
MMLKVKNSIFFILLGFFFLTACSPQPTTPKSKVSEPKDGVYLGYSRLVDVKVTIKGGKIAAIEIVEHRGGGKKYENMILPLAKEIVKTQSLEVDTISGATASSNYLINAVKEALDKATVSPARK